MKYINKKILSNNQGILHAKFLLNMNSICKGRCEDMVDFQIERSLQEDGATCFCQKCFFTIRRCYTHFFLTFKCINNLNIAGFVLLLILRV
jgi:hypothetical protein